MWCVLVNPGYNSSNYNNRNYMKCSEFGFFFYLHAAILNQSAWACAPRPVRVCMASVLCLSIHTLETHTGKK